MNKIESSNKSGCDNAKLGDTERVWHLENWNFTIVSSFELWILGQAPENLHRRSLVDLGGEFG